MSGRRLPGADLREVLRPALPQPAAPQVHADELVPGLMAEVGAGARVVDLGCGRGNSVDLFRAVEPGVDWVGVELADSELFAQRTRDDAAFVTFDGVHLPFEDASVDLVFCKQVLEHVECPEALVPEVARILRPGGVFAGSTSHLEPYHGWSTANFTPYGLKRLLERSDFDLATLWPGIDGPTLIARRLLRGPAWMNRWWFSRSPLNTLVDGAARVTGWDAEDRNALKLLLCGHYAFVARRRRAVS
jgi:SAM-dependent methyltransferase